MRPMDAQRAVATSDVFFTGKDLVKVSRQAEHPKDGEV